MKIPQSIQDNYLSCFKYTWEDNAPVPHVRFVVLDCETTGLDPKKDSLITIGAVTVIGGQIELDDSYEALIRIPYNTSSVVVHGITREESQQGREEPEVIQEFLSYLRDGVIVGHHIMHDVQTLNVATQKHFGFELSNRVIDTMDLTLHLEADGAFADLPEIRSFSLDSLCDLFNVTPHDRHTAAGDAFITAQIFLKLLRLARHQRRTIISQIDQRFEPEE